MVWLSQIPDAECPLSNGTFLVVSLEKNERSPGREITRREEKELDSTRRHTHLVVIITLVIRLNYG